MNALQGRERLWRVWWLYGAALSLAGSVLGLLAVSPNATIRVGAIVLLGVLTLTWVVMVWRCADNSVLHVGPMVRACLVAGVLGVLFMLLLFKNVHVTIG